MTHTQLEFEFDIPLDIPLDTHINCTYKDELFNPRLWARESLRRLEEQLVIANLMRIDNGI
jgi:hypothetical protein